MKSKDYSFNQFMLAVADYIDDEYGGNRSSSLRDLTHDERYTIKHMLHIHYENYNSVNNTANDIMKYLSDNKAWTNKNDIMENN
jgi:transposase